MTKAEILAEFVAAGWEFVEVEEVVVEVVVYVEVEEVA